MSKENSVLFQQLYGQYAGMVRQMCLGYMKGNAAEADDLVQEIFTIVWRKLASFRGEAQYKTWIYRITVNSCLHQIRKQKKMPLRSIDTLSNEPADPGTDRRNEEQLQSLYKAIGELEEVDRLLVMLSLEGEKQEAIAEVLGLKPGTVRVRIHRLKKTLSTRLKKQTNGF